MVQSRFASFFPDIMWIHNRNTSPVESKDRCIHVSLCKNFGSNSSLFLGKLINGVVGREAFHVPRRRSRKKLEGGSIMAINLHNYTMMNETRMPNQLKNREGELWRSM